jgi:glycyl-tRNA synthetase
MANNNENPELFEKIVNLAKRRGFVFPSSEIYGGIRSTYDYGPLGTLMLRNVKGAWWKAIVQERLDVVAIDAAILTNPKVWEASGHLATFTDPLVDCLECNERWREDQLPLNEDGRPFCPNCRSVNLTEARPFNLMFKTFVGPVESSTSVAYLRPETAQGMFVNFTNVLNTTRRKPPFGIAQIGRSFRNEITPGNFVFRTREFEQMEMEYFVPPEEADHWHEYWCNERYSWYIRFGIKPELIRLRKHDKEELSHYSAATSDIEFLFPWGWGELEGIANRTDYDLTAHSNHSGTRLEYFDQNSQRKYTPYVIEPAAGATRAMMAFLLAAYDEDEIAGEKRTVLRLHPQISPYQVAILPLSKKEELTDLTGRIFRDLSKQFMCDFDDTQSIGRRYRRQDEIGTPICLTVDFQSLEDGQVTLRDRDTTAQTRVAIEDLANVINTHLTETQSTI